MSSPGMSLSDAISGYQAGLQTHAADVTEKIGEAKKTYEERIAAADKAEAALSEDALKPPVLKPPPQPDQGNAAPLREWGSAAMAIAALGGLLTRQPLTNSLNAAAGVLNAYKANDAAAAKQAYDVWKTETENAVKMAQFSIDAYKTALAKIDTDKKTALADFTTTAKALGDENAAYVATHYGIDAAVRYVDAQQAHVDRMLAAGPRIEALNEREQNYHALLKARNDLVAAKQKGDPKAIQAAQGVFNDAVQKVKDFDVAMTPGGAAAAIRSAEAGEKAQQKYGPLIQQYDTAIKLIDKTLKMMTPEMIGTRGFVARNVEGVTGQLDPMTATPARNFANSIADIQTQVRNLVAKSHYMSTGAVESLHDQITGMDKLDTYGDVKNSLENMRGILSDQKDELQSKLTYQAGDVVTGADGKKYRVTGGDPSDPDVEPVDDDQ